MTTIRVFDNYKRTLIYTYYSGIIPVDGGVIEIKNPAGYNTPYKITAVSTILQNEKVTLYVTLYVIPVGVLRDRYTRSKY